MKLRLCNYFSVDNGGQEAPLEEAMFVFSQNPSCEDTLRYLVLLTCGMQGSFFCGFKNSVVFEIRFLFFVSQSLCCYLEHVNNLNVQSGLISYFYTLHAFLGAF